MKKVLLIALALISCFAAEAQLRTIKPKWTYKVPNISHSEYMKMVPSHTPDDYQLFWDLYFSDGYGTVDSITASSTLSSQGAHSYRAANLKDSNIETAWVEGVSGYGVGQWIKYQGVRQEQISRIHILNGYVKSDKAWSENARVKRLKVYRDGRPLCILELQNSRSLQTFRLPWAGDCSYINRLRFEILEVYPGTKYQDTVISEIYFTAAP